MNRFERLHALLSQKPRANLGFFPTPLYKLDRLSAVSYTHLGLMNTAAEAGKLIDAVWKIAKAR